MGDSAKMRKFSEDTVIIREGEVQNAMYKIISGKVAVYIKYGEEDEYLLGVLGEQQCFGVTGILYKDSSMFTVVAISDVLIMSVEEEEFDDFIQKNHQNTKDIIRNLAKEVVNLKCHLNMLMDELSNGNEDEKCKVQQLREKMYQYAVSSAQKESWFSIKV